MPTWICRDCLLTSGERREFATAMDLLEHCNQMHFFLVPSAPYLITPSVIMVKHGDVGRVTMIQREEKK